MSNLRHVAAQTCAADFLTEDRIAGIKAELTSAETKFRVAKDILQDAAQLYLLSEQDLEDLARRFVDPSQRRLAEASLRRFPFRDPRTEWAGTGFALVMDVVFAEDDPDADVFVVAVPAHWSLDLWHHERDLYDDGYHYSRWVYATLPHVVDDDRSDPMAYVLVSENLYGTLYWGDQKVSIYRGEVTIKDDRSSVTTMSVITDAVSVAV